MKIVSSGQGSGGDGTTHTCALLTGGALKCWGSNGYGQLGDGTTVSKTSPVTIFSSGVADVEVAWGNHTCAIFTDGSLKCWGSNSSGELGQGTTSGTPQLTPVSVAGYSSATSVAATGLAGYGTTCAIENGGVKCWGRGVEGQLGNGASVSQSSPVQVSGLTSGVVKVTLDSGDSCALLSNGNVKCWGSNSYGEFGTREIKSYNTPQTLLGLGYGVIDFDMGYSGACAVVVGGGVKCWGANLSGNMGIGVFNINYSPTDIPFP